MIIRAIEQANTCAEFYHMRRHRLSLFKEAIGPLTAEPPANTLMGMFTIP
jgi:hypothetical protein